MMIIGCDFHPAFQQVAYFDEETGESGQMRLDHRSGQAERFYRRLRRPVRVGIEACGQSLWFERLLEELGHELWVGDPAEIRARSVRKQKHDRRDARHLLELMRNGCFPRLWRPTPAEHDLRQLLVHRFRLVQARTRVKNQLQGLALSQGLQRGARLWSRQGQAQLRALPLAPWSHCRRQDLLGLLAELNRCLAPLDQAVEQLAEQHPVAQRLQTHPGVGPVVALSFALVIGEASRFASRQQLTSYLGLNPSERSSAGRQRLGHISKQGNAMMRALLLQSAHAVVRCEPQWRRFYVRLAMKKNRAVAAVAVARKLAVRLWWMWRRGQSYEQFRASGSHAGRPVRALGCSPSPSL